MRRLLLVVALAALATTGCTDGPDTVDAGPAPSRPTTTQPAGPGDATPSPAPGSGRASARTTSVLVYLTRGGSLERVRRDVPSVPRIGAEAVKALLRGPTPREVRAGLGTAVPADTGFLGLTISAGTASVDLSRQFESGGGTLGLTLRLAQVACTLDQFATIAGVRFALEGRPVSVFSGDGIVLDRPVTCDSYRRYLPGGAPAATPAPPGPPGPTPVLEDGIPQVTVSPSRGPAGARVHIEGDGFTDEQWRSPDSSLWLVGSGDGGCQLYAAAEHSVHVSPDGHLMGDFVVPGGNGECRQEGRPAPVAPGRYTVVYQCTPCTIGRFEVTP
jgi:spore germination protein GerM